MGTLSLYELEEVCNNNDNIAVCLEEAAVLLHNEGRLQKSRDSAFKLLQLAASLNERNKNMCSDSKRAYLERLLTPFIIKADELLEEDKGKVYNYFTPDTPDNIQ